MLKIIYRLCVTRRLRFPLNRGNIWRLTRFGRLFGHFRSAHGVQHFTPFTSFSGVINARRYASAEYAVVVCLSVRPFVTRRYCIETTGRIGLVFDIDASFHTVLQGNSSISKK